MADRRIVVAGIGLAVGAFIFHQASGGPSLGAVLCIAGIVALVGYSRVKSDRAHRRLIKEALDEFEREGKERYVDERRAGLTDTQAQLNVTAWLTNHRGWVVANPAEYLDIRRAQTATWAYGDGAGTPMIDAQAEEVIVEKPEPRRSSTR